MKGDEIKVLSDLLNLEKLSKAEEVNDDEERDDEDEYNEEYMKKYMKKFMKSNRDYVAKCSEDLGFVKKAIDTEVENIEGIEEADATLVDGTSFINALSDGMGVLAKAVAGIIEEMAELRSELEYQTELSKASGGVLVKAAEALDELSSAPLERRGHDFAPQDRSADGGGNGSALRKAKNLSVDEIKRMALRAAQEGDNRAASLVTDLDCCNGNLGMLRKASINLIEELAS